MKNGWFHESHRHSLAARGVKTTVNHIYHAEKTSIVGSLFREQDARRARLARMSAPTDAADMAETRARTPLNEEEQRRLLEREVVARQKVDVFLKKLEQDLAFETATRPSRQDALMTADVLEQAAEKTDDPQVKQALLERAQQNRRMAMLLPNRLETSLAKKVRYERKQEYLRRLQEQPVESYEERRFIRNASPDVRQKTINLSLQNALDQRSDGRR